MQRFCYRENLRVLVNIGLLKEGEAANYESKRIDERGESCK